jgi:hypothetical protein
MGKFLGNVIEHVVEGVMVPKNLTPENLKKLIEISNDYNFFSQDYMTEALVSKKNPEDTFLNILWFTSYKLYEIYEFKRVALDFIYKKKLSEMPLYVNDNTIEGAKLDSSGIIYYFNWISIVAQWRLVIGC